MKGQPEREYHNVIIFGAGASFDAGIPLLASFVDTMWAYARRGKVGEASISADDVTILNKANDIRNDLERYNSRAAFDNRNLEDILSLLSFEALSGNDYSEKYNAVVKAVARPIELSCNIKSENCTPEASHKHDKTLYHKLWEILLNQKRV